jgi:hypothetical protein
MTPETHTPSSGLLFCHFYAHGTEL